MGHTHTSSAVHVGAQPAMGDGNHWRQQHRLILDSALRSRDWEEGRKTTGANGGKNCAAPWDHNSLGVAGPIDYVSLEQLQQRFITVVKMQPGLATAYATGLTHVLGLLNHALGAHRPNRQSKTPSSLLWAIKLWYIVPALLHSQDSCVKRRERFVYVERGDIALILSWLME